MCVVCLVGADIDTLCVVCLVGADIDVLCVVCLVGADIDTLCVGPRHIEHKDFFDTFYKKLEACSQVKNLHVSVFWMGTCKCTCTITVFGAVRE